MRKLLPILAILGLTLGATAQVVAPGNTNVFYCPTQSPGTNNTFCASTAFVQAALSVVSVAVTQITGLGTNVLAALQANTNSTSGIMPQPTPWVAGNGVKIGASGGVADLGYTPRSQALPSTVSGCISGGVTYCSSNTQESSSALLTQFGPIYGGGAGAAPVSGTPGTSGQIYYGNTGAAPAFGTPGFVQATPANPTGTASTTGVMMGLAGAFTPAVTGRALITVTGTVTNSVASDGGKYQIRTGTGGAPANGAVLTGTAQGAMTPFGMCNTAPSCSYPVSSTVILTGLTLATPIWIDISLAAVTGGTASITNVVITAVEF